MKYLYSFAIASIFTFSLHAQPLIFNWAALQGGAEFDIGSVIAVDGAGNVYTSGEFRDAADFDPGSGTVTFTTPTSSADAFVCKFDSTGQLAWARQLEGNNSMSVTSMALDAGYVYTAGYFRGSVDFDPGTGVNSLTSEGFDDVYLLKLDSDGSFVWVKQIGNEGSTERIRGLAMDATGNIYCSGVFMDSLDVDPGPGVENVIAVDDYDTYVLKLDAQGNYIWSVSFGGENAESNEAIALDNAGNIYTTGYFRDTANFDPNGTQTMISDGLEDIYILKLDNDGNFVWSKRVGGINGDHSTDIGVDANGNVLLCGQFKDEVDFDPGAGEEIAQANDRDAFFLKLTSDGNFVWVRSVGGNSFDVAEALATDGNDIVFTGQFFGNIDINPGPMPEIQWLDEQGNGDIFILKLDENGNFVWGGNVGSDSGFDYPNDVAARQGSAYVTGAMDGTPMDGNPTSDVFNLTAYGESDIFTMRVSDGFTSVDSHQGSSNISVYPNPFADNFIVNTSEVSNNAYIRITDAIGKLIYESFDVQRGFTNVSLDKQPAGVYFLHLRSDNEKAVAKIVKE